MLLWPGQASEASEAASLRTHRKMALCETGRLLCWAPPCSPPAPHQASDRSFLSSDLSSLSSLPPLLGPTGSARPGLMEKQIWGIMSWFSQVHICKSPSKNYSLQEILLLSYQNTPHYKTYNSNISYFRHSDRDIFNIKRMPCNAMLTIIIFLSEEFWFENDSRGPLCSSVVSVTSSCSP